jgi:Uma2 family endonuclease
MASVSTLGVDAILSRPAHLLYAEEQFVSVEEYLTSSYRPDMDYVDGHLEVRNLGELEHARLQRALLEAFLLGAADWRIEVLQECRVQISSNRFRVPDLLILSLNEPEPERIVKSAPLLCIEVLSPRDTFKRIETRVQDYVGMGVRHVWLFDPKDLGRVMVVEKGVSRWTTERKLLIEGTAIEIDLDQVQKRASRTME